MRLFLMRMVIIVGWMSPEVPAATMPRMDNFVSFISTYEQKTLLVLYMFLVLCQKARIGRVQPTVLCSKLCINDPESDGTCKTV
jgi:hypothetical protein